MNDYVHRLMVYLTISIITQERLHRNMYIQWYSGAACNNVYILGVFYSALFPATQSVRGAPSLHESMTIPWPSLVIQPPFSRYIPSSHDTRQLSIGNPLSKGTSQVSLCNDSHGRVFVLDDDYSRNFVIKDLVNDAFNRVRVFAGDNLIRRLHEFINQHMSICCQEMVRALFVRAQER